MKADVTIGMLLSQFVTWTIITTTAGSLHLNGVTDIETADQAAQALEPLVKTFPYAGELSKLIFALGIIGTGCLLYRFLRDLLLTPCQILFDGKKD